MAAYDVVYFRGKRLNKRTIAMILEVERRLGRTLYIVQGSYNSSVGASAGTHDGGGAIDTSAYDYGDTVMAMRKVGFAAWYRPAIPGLWGAHIHAIAIGDKELSSGARNQVTDYYNGRNGLANNGPDNGPRISPIPVFDYREPKQESEYASGDVYVHRLVAEVEDSDSVRRMKYQLKKRDADQGGSPGLKINGAFGLEAVKAVKKWQQAIAETGPNDGSRLSLAQANRLFGDKYNVISEEEYRRRNR